MQLSKLPQKHNLSPHVVNRAKLSRKIIMLDQGKILGTCKTTYKSLLTCDNVTIKEINKNYNLCSWGNFLFYFF